ncbi:hypothetical protein BRD03_09200 [Halobacteriales archaeon QS_9_68_17]|nr:MAG: hypothetical protein BRD03_09200 [Halobacteriales archaeon QS_9_68_17]
MEADHHQQGDEEEADPRRAGEDAARDDECRGVRRRVLDPMTYVPTVVSIAAGNVETICPGATGDSG